MSIYALSSGQGASGIAVIRISGSNTKKVLKNLTFLDPPTPKLATLTEFKNPETKEVIDEGILLWFPGPQSYTGEDMAEIHIHGSKAVINEIYRLISKIDGCRLAEPGEFTKIAFQNGKVNLLKAESISDLISSETEIQRQQAIKMMSGKSSDKFNSLRKRLLKILSNIEAKIDFPEDDLPNNILENIQSEAKSIKEEIQKILNDQRVGERIREGFKISIVGPTNAGKSSLLNYLSKRDVAIVSEIAGTTRDIIEVHLNLDGYPVVISDTAGIRDSKDEIEKKGIRLSLKKAENADLKLVVVDAKNVDLRGYLNDLLKNNAILVVNKSDLINKKLDAEISKLNPVLISLKNNTNINMLISRIKNSLKNKFISEEDILITRERHRQHLLQCVHYLEEFLLKNEKKDFDKAAEDLRLATRHLGMIVGKVDVEEILGSIFNDFCIGK